MELDFKEIPLSIIEETKNLVYNPVAKREYEIFMGAILWSDEYSEDTLLFLEGNHKNFFRPLWIYRTSLIKEIEQHDLYPYQEDFRKRFPQWPGFRPERSSIGLRVFLQTQEKKLRKEITKFEKICL